MQPRAARLLPRQLANAPLLFPRNAMSAVLVDFVAEELAGSHWIIIKSEVMPNDLLPARSGDISLKRSTPIG